MRGLFFGGVIFIWIWLSLAKPVWAETIRVSLTADEIHYDYYSKQIEAKGNVQISYKKTMVHSDQAVIDHDQNILLATGSVKVNKDGDEFNGDRFLYYLETQQGWVYPVATEITDEEVEGPLKFTAAEAFLKGEEILFKKTYLTGCELEHPHYHFTASKVEYIPGDRIKMTHVWYWEHRVRLLYFPVLFISLEEDSNNFGMQVGWNNYDGWWIKTWYTYYFSDQNSLMASNITTQHGTDNWEFQHIYKLSSTRTFTETFGIEDKSKIGNPNEDYKISFKFEDKTYPKLNYETSLQSRNRYTVNSESYWENEYNFTLRGQSPYPFLALDYDILGLEKNRKINFQESWNYNFNPTTGVYIRGRWYYDESSIISTTKEPTENFSYDFQLNKRWERSQLAFKVYESRTVDYYSENLKPDITYTIPKLDLPLIGDVRVVSQYTDKEKYNGVTDITNEGQRYALDLEKNNSLWSKGSLRLNNKLYYRFRDYSVDNIGSQLTTWTEELDLTKNFTEKLSSTVSVAFSEVKGENNVFFNDNIRPGAEIWNSWDWKGQYLNASLKSGYNFQTVYAYPVKFDASWRSDSTQVSFKTEYHWDNGPDYQVGLGRTSLEITSNPKQDWHVRFNLAYDFWDQVWWSKIMDLRLTQPIGDKFKVGMNATYDMFANDFSNANIGLTYDWHCRELEFHYDWVEREYWLQLTFKAFPQARFNTSENPMEYLNYGN